MSHTHASSPKTLSLLLLLLVCCCAAATIARTAPPLTTMLDELVPLTPRPLDDGAGALELLYLSLPVSPVSTIPYLFCAAAADDDDDKTDRVSRLPDDLLRRVVSLLPAKDGARTTVLSSRWRGLWHSAPLVLVDTHFLSEGAAGVPPAAASAGAVSRAVSAALEAHPGPFPFASFTCSFIDGADRHVLARWFQLLATKGVKQLTFANPTGPLPGVRLPSSLFSCADLRRLWIGAWVFPETATLPRGAGFPNLRELVLGCTVMEDTDLDFVLAASPVLEILVVAGSQAQLHARLASPSLRSAQFCLSTMDEVAVVDAPSLERLFLMSGMTKMSTTVKIGHAPKLRLLGYLEPGMHILQIGNTTIKAGTKASESTTVPSVQMLGLQLHFGVGSEIKMLPSFLRCFPSVETLIVQCVETRGPTTKLSVKFWQGTSPIEWVQSQLKTLFFRELQGYRGEFHFLTFIAENAQKLESMYIWVKSGLSYSRRLSIGTKLRVLKSAKWANRDCKMLFRTSTFPDGGTPFNLAMGVDLSFADPFFCQ